MKAVTYPTPRGVFFNQSTAVLLFAAPNSTIHFVKIMPFGLTALHIGRNTLQTLATKITMGAFSLLIK